MELDYTNMIESGVHFGHQKKRWNPKFRPYLHKHLNGISIINLEKTLACLEKAGDFLTERVKEGATVLFVGTKKQAQDVIRECAQAVEMPFCANRWLGGCLTNFETVKTSLAKYQRFLQMEESGELAKLPKKEGAVIKREMVRMQRSFEGIRNLSRRPDVLVIVDVKNEEIAIREAKRLQIPIVGVVDTNSDPSIIDFPIPANDDSTKSLSLIFEYLQEAVQKGIELHKLAKVKNIPTSVAKPQRAQTHTTKGSKRTGKTSKAQETKVAQEPKAKEVNEAKAKEANPQETAEK